MGERFESVWDAIYEGEPDKIAEMKERSKLLMEITNQIRLNSLNVGETGNMLGIDRERAQALIDGKVSQFDEGELRHFRDLMGLD